MDVVWVAWLVLVLLGVRSVFAAEWRLEVLWLRVAWWGGVSLLVVPVGVRMLRQCRPRELWPFRFGVWAALLTGSSWFERCR